MRAASRWPAPIHGRVALPTACVATTSQRRAPALMGDTLPATPDTYLALRTSPQALNEIPAAAIETLIYEAGRAGLAGLVTHIIADVLHHRVATTGSLRQQRLLLALLRMSAAFRRRLPVEPNMLVRLALRLLELTNGSQIPPHVAAHVLKQALTLRRKDDKLHTLILVLFERWASSADYPILEEGIEVVEYLLRYSDADPTRVMELVSQMASSEDERLGKAILEQAHADGLAWQRWARENSGWMAVASLRETTQDLKLHALRISLWSLCCRAWIRLYRVRRFRAAVQDMRATLQRASQLVAPSHDMPPSSTHVLRSLLQSHLMYLAGQYTINATRAALETIRHVPPAELVRLMPSVLARLCSVAVELDDADTAGKLLLCWIKSAWSTSTTHETQRAVAASLSPTILLAAVPSLAAADATAAQHLVELAWGPGPGLEGADTLPTPLRAQALVLLCQLGLAKPARTLYMRWMGSSGVPIDDVLRANMQSHLTGQGASCAALAQKALDILGPVPAVPTSATCSPPPPALSMPLTPTAMLALVRLFGRRARAQRPLNRKWARAVRDDFLCQTYAHAQPRHEHLTALMHASFILEEPGVALRALTSILACGYELEAQDAAALLRGIVDAKPDGAVEALQCLPPTLASNAKLYAVVVARCLSAGRLDMVRKVYHLASQRGLAPQLQQLAPAALLPCSTSRPASYVALVLRMLREGWKLDPFLLHWIVRSAVRGLRLYDAASMTPSPRTRRVQSHDMEAALDLFTYTIQRFRDVDFATCRFVLCHLERLLRTKASTPDQNVWIARLDRVVALILQTRIARRASMTWGKDLPQNSEAFQAYDRVRTPPSIWHQGLLCYEAIGDAAGALELLEFLYIHKQLSPDDLAACRHHVLRRYAAVDLTASRRTKPWWHAASCT